MNGTIIFRTVAELAEFLRAFAGCTASFTVVADNRGYVLTFDGGY